MSLEIKDLNITLSSGDPVVENISFQLEKGEMLSIVGSSGAGKTTICKAVMGLLGNAYRAKGSILFHGRELLTLPDRERRTIYGKEICLIMQNPMTAFNPSIRVGRQLEKTYRLHHSKTSRKEMYELFSNLLQRLGLEDTTRILKSTTASLIPRFYDVQEGAVKIGGVDIREIAHADLMKMVAFVFQDPKLFKDSLLENIRAGRPTATREEVLRAAHMAQCDDILEKFPDGIDTVVGSKGVYLSGGETQRIAIARAILKDAPIVVLDEATAYADPENEQQIQQAFKSLVTGKTVIMIAHRLSTVQDADLILVMKNGELTESGTHDALVQQNGEYAKMWANYTKTTKWHIGNEVKVC